MVDGPQPTMTNPKLSAKRSKTSLHDTKLATTKPTSSVHSFDSTVSEPPTPTWSIRGHGRHPSSNSSLASSPPCADMLDLSGSCTRLSQLAEEPPEPESDCVLVDDDIGFWSCLCDAQPCAHTIGAGQQQTPMSPVSAFSDSFAMEQDSVLSRSSSMRRRNPDADTSSIASRFTNRFPSLSRKWMQRKPTLSVAIGYATPPRGPSSRSSSLSSNAVPALDNRDAFMDAFASSLNGHASSMQPSAAIDIPNEGHLSDPIDRAALASTPLLPPMIDEAKAPHSEVQSPLQSPTVADSRASLYGINSPILTPQLQGIMTPPVLSTKPSATSLRARSGTLASTDIPPLMISDPSDPWTIKLGHANYTISPAPYIPHEFTAESVAQLFSDWERARHNFTKHQHRTGEHFGATSKTYKLTDEKWAEIDACWKQNYEFTVAEASRNGNETLPDTPVEPAPLMKIPSLNDPNAEGKFPTLGDEDIVGPMVRAAAPVLPKSPSRTRTLFKLLSNLTIPNTTSTRPR